MPRKYKYCSVDRCRSSSKNSNIRFYSFPRNKERFELWKKFCNDPSLDEKNESTLKRHNCVCSLHFAETDFNPHKKESLKVSAIPSIKDPPPCPQDTNDTVIISDSTNVVPGKRPYLIKLQILKPSKVRKLQPTSQEFQDNPEISPTSQGIISSPHSPELTNASNEDVNYVEISPFLTLELETAECEVITSEPPLDCSSNNVNSDSSLTPASTADSTSVTTLNSTRSKQLLVNPKKLFLYEFAKKKEIVIALKRLRKKYAKQSQQARSLKDICCLKPVEYKEVTRLSKQLSCSTMDVIVSQLNRSIRKPKDQAWTLEEKVMALSLFMKGPKVYHLLRYIFSLPREGTLKSMLKSIPFNTGINKLIFSNLTLAVRKLDDRDKQCVLLFDQMNLSEKLLYDSSLDLIVGVKDHGDQGRSSELANCVLVFMACGLFKKWKQPVAFYFCTKKGISSKLIVKHIKTVIGACTKAGLHVLATLCDMGSNFVKAVKQLGSTPKAPTFSFEGRDIVTLFDPSHLVKSTRNMLQKHDVSFQVKTGNFDFKGKASWRYIKEIYDRDNLAGSFRWLWKLTGQHINPTLKNKLKVKLASQVFSHSVAAAIIKDVSRGLMSTEAIGTAYFVELLDRLFDSFNGVQVKSEKCNDLNCWITSNSPHHRFWDDMFKCINGWKFESSQPGQDFRAPLQDGWLTTMKGMHQLWELVSKNRRNGNQVDFLVPRTVNLDALENAFCSIRSHCGSNRNPSASKFVDTLKTCIINGFDSQDFRQRSNCEEDGATLLSDLRSLLSFNPLGTRKSSAKAKGPDIVDKSVRYLSLPTDLTSTANVSGFIARRILAENECHGCRAGLLNSAPNEVLFSGIFFKEYTQCRRQKLTYPSLELARSVGHCATILERVLEEMFHTDRVMETVTTAIQQEVDFGWFELHCPVHYQDLTPKIAKIVCEIGIPWWCKMLNRALKETNVKDKNG